MCKVLPPVLVEMDLPEGVELWNYGGSYVLTGVKMDKVRFETIRGGLPGKIRQHVTGWRVLGA